MAENPYQSPREMPTLPPDPPSLPVWLAILKSIGLLAITGAAIAAFAWMVSGGLSPWWFVAGVLAILAGAIAWQSWRAAVAFVVAAPVGFLVGAGCWPAWFWIVRHTSFGQLFNGKGSGPFGILVFVVLPGLMAFLAVFGLGCYVLRVDGTGDTSSDRVTANGERPESAASPDQPR